MTKEIWRDIEGYEGLYRVSNRGRVLSLKRPYANGGILSPGHTTYGYHQVVLRKGGKSKCFVINRLVLQHFSHNPDNKPETNHKNGIKDDNRIENLEWVTKSENALHAYRTGLMRKDGEYNSRSKLNQFQVRVIRKSDLRQYELANIFNVTQGNISSIKTRRSWT